MQTYVVTTQGLENYGAHTEDGRFESGNACWKFKVGSTYLIEGVHRQADAMAFVQAILYSKRDANGIGWKEFPSTCDTYDGWYERIHESIRSRSATRNKQRRSFKKIQKRIRRSYRSRYKW